MNITKIPQDEFNVQEWSGGQTTEIFILPEGASYKDRSFSTRISSATVELESSTFTILPDVHRFICPLDNELELFSNGTSIAKLEPFEIFEFSGSTPITSRGKCRDFNLMVKGNRKDYMRVWDSNTHPTMKIKLISDHIFWMFSYDSKGIISVFEEGSFNKTTDAKLAIDKMLLININNVDGDITLSTELKTKIIYGVIHLR